MRFAAHLIAFILFSAVLSTFTISCAFTGPGCDTETPAEDADSDDGCPTGLSCNEHGGCNSDYPYCCSGVCRDKPCTSS